MIIEKRYNLDDILHRYDASLMQTITQTAAADLGLDAKEIPNKAYIELPNGQWVGLWQLTLVIGLDDSGNSWAGGGYDPDDDTKQWSGQEDRIGRE